MADSGKVDKTKLADGGIQYDIYNQQVNKGSALNKFTDFGIGQKDVANLQLGSSVDRQINLVKNRIDIDGVVNAIKDNKIGGDVYFFSDAGIDVGATGVFNVGRLTLGTNAAHGEALYNGGMEKHLAQSAASQAKAVAGGSDITLQGKVYAQGDVVLGAGSVNVKGGEIRTHRNNADTYADKKAVEAYRNQLVNVSPSATVAKALGHGDIALAAVGASSVAKPFETKGAIVIDQAYMDAAGGDTSVIASAERNGGNLMGSKADASVEISNATIQGQNVAISAETKVSGKVGSADAYKTGAEEDGILGLLHETFGEQVGSLASVVKTGADSRVTVKDSKLTAAEDLTISSKAESEIGSETGGALGVGINVGIADVSSKVEIQGKSVLTAEKDLAISAEGSNAIDLQRQGSVEDLPIAIDLGWAEAKTDASVTVAKDATLKAKENVDVSAKAERNLSVEVENSSGDGTLGLAVGITMESSTVNGAGSSGLHAQEGASGSGTSSIGDLAGTLLNAGKSEKDKKSIDSGDSALTKVASQDASMGENVGKAKGGFAAAANVSVNRITDAAKAYTQGNAVTADALTIRSGNDSQITTGAGAIALGLSQNSSAIAGSFMYNAITDKNEAYAEDAALKLTGREKDDTSLTVEADNAAKITNIAASGSGAAKGSAVAGQISLNWVDNTTYAHVKGGSLKADKATTISAKDQGTIDSYTGAVAVSGGGNGAAVGASIAANLIKGDTKSYLENSEVAGTAEGEKAGKLSVTADETSEIQSIVAAGAGSGKLAAAFSASGNWIHTTTDAHISNANDMKTGALSVLAKNGSNATIGVGSAAIGGNSAGASIGVMVNQSAVSASLTGDEAKEKTITADGITVKADNAYNGDASESDQTAKTVAVGFAGGTSQFAGSGSVTVNVINQTTDATIGKGKYDAGQKAAQVAATSTAKLFGLAGGVSLSAGSGLGAAVDVQTYKGHTYAGLADGASLTNASSAHVNAESAEHMTSIAATGAGGAGSFAGAGAAGAHSIATDTKAYIGQQSEVTEAGVVSVTAKDETKLNTVAGSGAASGNTGVGLTAAVEVVDKKVSASVGDGANVTGDTLTVKADNTSSVTAAAGLGAAGTAGLAGAASETFVTHTTDAHVGKNTQVSAVNGVDILAHSNFTQGAAAGSVGGGGTVGMDLTNSTVSFTGDTAAYADEKAVINGGKKVNISASQLTNVDYSTVAGAVGGTASLSGTVGVNVLKTTTKAYAAGSSQLSAKTADAERIAVTASDETTLKGVNGGAAIGVTNISKDTKAFLGGSAALDTAGKTKISAENKESLTNVTVQAAGGLYAGLAGAVNVTNLSAVTKAYTGDDVSFNQADKKRQRCHGRGEAQYRQDDECGRRRGGRCRSTGGGGRYRYDSHADQCLPRTE